VLPSWATLSVLAISLTSQGVSRIAYQWVNGFTSYIGIVALLPIFHGFFAIVVADLLFETGRDQSVRVLRR
jgi:hypothetical protein